MINRKPCSRKGMGDGPGKRESKSCMSPDWSKQLSHSNVICTCYPLRSSCHFGGKKKESRCLKLLWIKSLSSHTFSFFSILASVAYTVSRPVHSQRKQRPLARSSRNDISQERYMSPDALKSIPYSPDLSCRAVCLVAFSHGSLNFLHTLEHAKLPATRPLSMPFPPTLPFTPWIYKNTQCK